MKKLYHLSLIPVEEFIPGVPTYRRPEENGAIKRICLSDSIENCLSAVSWFGSSSSPEDIMTEVGSKIIFVYEFEIEEHLLKTPEEVYNIGNVCDAILNQEYWYIGEETLLPKHSYTISIIDCFEEEHTVLSPKLQKIYDLNNGDIDVDKYYNLKEGLYYGTVYRFKDLYYKKVDKILMGDSFSISYTGDLVEDYEDIINSAFEKHITLYEYNFSRIEDVFADEGYITVSTIEEFIADKSVLISSMRDLGLNVTNILEIEW